MNINYTTLRKASLLCLMGSFILGVGLYHAKHKVVTLERELRQTRKSILQIKESLHILKAEWGFLNNPKRLEQLNEKYLYLKPVNAVQIASLETLKQKGNSSVMVASLEEPRGKNSSQPKKR